MNLITVLKKSWIILLSAAVLFLLPVIFLLSNTSQFYGHELNQPATEFELFDTQGDSHQLSMHKGKYTFLYFGYLNCNEVCHNQVGVMFNISRQAVQKNIDFIFVSLDPKRDSPKQLDLYFNQLGANFYALYHPNIQVIQTLANAYKSPFYIDRIRQAWSNDANDYEIQHPGYLYLIDPDGIIRLMYPNMHLRYDYILQDLGQLNQAQMPSS